jgi:hypothetical protein
MASILDYLKQDYRVCLLKRLYIYFSILLILFFVGLRYKLASDWLTYTMFYDSTPTIDKIDFDTIIEPGFVLLLSLFKTFGLNFEFLIFFVTLYGVISLFFFVNRNQIRNKITFIAIILILNVFREFDILRQSLAFYTMLYAFSDKKVKFLKYLLICTIAISFHYTAVIFIIFYFFKQIKITKVLLFLVLIFYFISLLYTMPIISSSIGIMDSSYEYIIKAQVLISSYKYERIITLATLLNLLFLIILFLNSHKLKSLTRVEINLLKMFVFYILIFIFCKEVGEVADRLVYYFAVGLVFMFCLSPTLLPIKNINKYYLIVPCLYIVMKLGLMYRDEAMMYGFTPYRNVILKSTYDENMIMIRYDKMQNLGAENESRKK